MATTRSGRGGSRRSLGPPTDRSPPHRGAGPHPPHGSHGAPGPESRHPHRPRPGPRRGRRMPAPVTVDQRPPRRRVRRTSPDGEGRGARRSARRAPVRPHRPGQVRAGRPCCAPSSTTPARLPGDVLLLAPPGKAKVQLETKGRTAREDCGLPPEHNRPLRHRTDDGAPGPRLYLRGGRSRPPLDEQGHERQCPFGDA